MAGSKTQYLSEANLKHLLGIATFTPPANLFVVLSTAAYSGTATGAACSEVTATDYARKSIANSSATWSAPTAALPSIADNLVDISWAPATNAWGTINSFYLADALTGGNLLWGADITNPQAIGVGDPAKIPAAALLLAED